MKFWKLSPGNTPEYAGGQEEFLSFLLGRSKPRPPHPSVISAVGAGGKTSLLFSLLHAAAGSGHLALITTTTHMFLPLPLLENGTAAGTPLVPEIREGGLIKCSAPSPDQLQQRSTGKDLILVEADGSRRLPVKIPGDHEPVILPETGCILAVYGLSALGQTLSEACHRPELFTLSPGPVCQEGGTRDILPSSVLLTPCLLGQMMREYYIQPLEKLYSDIPVIPVWNQADNPGRLEAARQAAEECGALLQLISCCR